MFQRGHISAWLMSLIGGIDQDAPVLIGPMYQFISQEDGELWLGPNDDNFTDNAGYVSVRVTIR
jgi:hypothetical protein